MLKNCFRNVETKWSLKYWGCLRTVTCLLLFLCLFVCFEMIYLPWILFFYFSLVGGQWLGILLTACGMFLWWTAQRRSFLGKCCSLAYEGLSSLMFSRILLFACFLEVSWFLSPGDTTWKVCSRTDSRWCQLSFVLSTMTIHLFRLKKAIPGPAAFGYATIWHPLCCAVVTVLSGCVVSWITTRSRLETDPFWGCGSEHRAAGIKDGHFLI